MKPTKKCSGPNCNRHAVAKGLCTTHYGQRRRGRPLTELPTRAIKECAIEGCGRVDIQAKGMCALHYGRMLRGGAPGGAAPKAYRDPESAFAARTTREGECPPGPDTATRLDTDRSGPTGSCAELTATPGSAPMGQSLRAWSLTTPVGIRRASMSSTSDSPAPCRTRGTSTAPASTPVPGSATSGRAAMATTSR